MNSHFSTFVAALRDTAKTRLAWLALTLASSLATGAADLFTEGVRTTDPLIPQEQQKAFRLPPGFDIQLVAAEPDINKPLNMAFDAKGRLWVTTSIEYPFPAPTNRVGRDRVMIFEDFGPNGRARKITQFADGLNIPIGIYPLTGARRENVGQQSLKSGSSNPNSERFGNAAIVWSIPNIWLLDDTDGDGKADRREVLYGPFDYTRDTHGNQASFRRGFDGWLYATHGYNNDSRVKGRDGHEIHMNSGNTYRMRLDGSRIEQHTWGQVNPFGLTWDPRGNLYSSDCHSAPVYQLLDGGYYPSFGKPHDGLGFAPVLMEHAHGSTAIDGIVYYADNLWPEEFRDNVFIGNVMTSRLNRDRLEFRGSTPRAIEMPDFLATTDPWFRPVDNQLGPDGALYIADFYNRIIGHYEVPLTHPGRDRERGRIWRIVYTGPTGTQPRLHERKLDLTAAPVEQLIRELSDPNLTWRMLAMNAVADRFEKTATNELIRAIEAPINSFQQVHALWLLHRFDALHPQVLNAAAKSDDPLTRVHAQRIAADTIYQDSLPRLATGTGPLQNALEIANAGLNDRDPLVQRCAAEALGKFNGSSFIRPLLDARAHVPSPDTHLLYVVRKSLRNQLSFDTSFKNSLNQQWTEADLRALSDVAVAVKSESAAIFLSQQLGKVDFDRTTLTSLLLHIARYAPVSELDRVGAFARSKFASDLDLQLTLIKSIQDGLAQRGAAIGGETRAWGSELAERLMASVSEAAGDWHNAPDEMTASTANPWILQQRASADGNKDSWFLCSLPSGGEQLMGILQSKTFGVPAKLSFFAAGHDGYPDKPAQKKNFIRLRAADTHAVLAETSPPRNDVARGVSWDLSAYTGKRAYLEVVDGDSGNAYAWLAVGRFDPAVVALPVVSPRQTAERQTAAARLAREMTLSQLAGSLNSILTDAHSDIDARVAAASALLSFDDGGARHLPAISKVFSDANTVSALRVKLAPVLMGDTSANGSLVMSKTLRESPYRLQLPLATALAARREGAEMLLVNVESGSLPARLLQDRALRDKVLAARPNNAAQRINNLTRELPPANAAVERLIDERRRAFESTPASADRGNAVFAQTCALCHQLESTGNLVGPQLDGIGNRGLERLLEDILDPNRNVDRAFRLYTITLKNGDVVSGLPRREEGEMLVLADSAGKDFGLRKIEIENRRESELSPMPANLGDILSTEQLNDLLTFLLSKRTPQK